MDLDECYNKKQIRSTRKDENLIMSLIEMAEIKEMTVKEAKLNKKNISAYVSMAYDSLREILDALCNSFGYKVLSHVCIGELLKKQIPNFLYEEFDRIIYIRNGINYYGVKIDFEQGKKIIEKIFDLKNHYYQKYLKEFTKDE